MTSGSIAFRFRLEGRVQGVWCRDGTVQLARRCGVRGHVRNIEDGSVEGVVAGDSASVGSFLVGLQQPSDRARVRQISLWPHDASQVPPGFDREDTSPTSTVPDASAP